MAEGCAQQAPIDWKAFLESSRAEVPLACLRPTFKNRLAQYLNKKIVVITNRFCPDWSGLAESIGFDGMEINDIGGKDNCGREVIERWLHRKDLNPTVGNLVIHLDRLPRQDILTDLGQKLLEEVNFHEDRHAQFEKENPIQDNTVSSPGMVQESSHILTIDDTLTTITIYDAFVCYDIRDLAFVREMIRRLENKGFRLFVPNRNDLGGANCYDMMTRIMSQRCRHMIVVLSNNSIQSVVCKFQSTYTFSLDPGAEDKRLVPVKIEDCPIPEPLRIMALCDFTQQDVIEWSWDRLEGSIRRPMPNQDLNLLPSSSSSSSSRSSSVVPLEVSRRSVPEQLRDTGYHSGMRTARQATASSLRRDCNVVDTPCMKSIKLSRFRK